MFFAETQNKLLYAVTHQTAAEIITSRADADKPNMGLTSWKGSIVRKQDILIAKNYLNENEIDLLNRLTMLFLESAELRVKERKDLTLEYWRNNVNGLLTYHGKDVLQGKGGVSNAEMEQLVNETYEKFNTKRKQIEAAQADQEDMKMLEEIVEKTKKN